MPDTSIFGINSSVLILVPTPIALASFGSPLTSKEVGVALPTGGMVSQLSEGGTSFGEDSFSSSLIRNKNQASATMTSIEVQSDLIGIVFSSPLSNPALFAAIMFCEDVFAE